MYQNVCPRCSTPLNENGICPSCGYQAANTAPQQYSAQQYQSAPNAADNGAAPYQASSYQPNNPQYPQQPVNPDSGYGYNQQSYPQQGYPQQAPENYPAQGYQQYPQQEPAQQPQTYYPQQYQQPVPPQQYSQQPVQPQQQIPQQPDDTSKKSEKTISKKKLLAIGIPAVAVILIVVLLFTVIIPAIKNSKKDDGTFSIGDTWEVEDQWSFKINGVYEITDRYSEHNINSDIPDPEAVYVIDYEFKNLGYVQTDEKEEKKNDNAGVNSGSNPNALNMFLKDSTFVDSQDESAFQYVLLDFSGDYKNAEIDETTHTWNVIGVNHKGDLTYTFEMDTDSKHGSKTHVATFKLTPDSKTTEIAKLRYEIDENAKKLTVGETWKVDDQWTLTINSVKKTSDRSKYSKVDYDVAAVYVIDYTYTNINYSKKDTDGLYFFFSTYTKDTADVKCEYYSLIGVDSNYTPAEFIAPGETKHCQESIAVSKAGGFIVDAPCVADDQHDSIRYHYGFEYYD